MMQGSVVNHDIQGPIALLDLCINLKHINIFGYTLHSLEGYRRVLAQRSLISIYIRMENLSSLKHPAFCNTGHLLKMMQGWPDLEKLHISHLTSSDHILVHNNCCPRLKDICINEEKISANSAASTPEDGPGCQMAPLANRMDISISSFINLSSDSSLEEFIEMASLCP